MPLDGVSVDWNQSGAVVVIKNVSLGQKLQE